MNTIKNKLFLMLVTLTTVAISSLILISCNKKSLLDIQPTDRYTGAAVFNDASLLQSYVYNAYNGLRAFTYPAVGGYDGVTDIMLWNRNYNGQAPDNNYYAGFQNYVEGNTTPDNVNLVAGWSSYYNYMAKINTYFENVIK